jgi:hypothetical protein
MTISNWNAATRKTRTVATKHNLAGAALRHCHRGAARRVSTSCPGYAELAADPRHQRSDIVLSPNSASDAHLDCAQGRSRDRWRRQDHWKPRLPHPTPSGTKTAEGLGQKHRLAGPEAQGDRRVRTHVLGDPQRTPLVS